MNRIMTRMDFSLLPYYFDLVSGGVILSVMGPLSKKFNRFKMPNLYNPLFRYANDSALDQLQNNFFKPKHYIVNEIFNQINNILDVLGEEERNQKIQDTATELDLTIKELKKYVK